jgi:copper homeostasis protein
MNPRVGFNLKFFLSLLFLLEICCFNLQSALIAQESGAHRVELCADPGEGGTTPSAGVIRSVRKKLQIPVCPIIRPRGGNFLFSKDEFEIMQLDIAVCKQSGCDGIVTGMLLENGKVDKESCSRLVELAYPLEVTFHRAFDRVLDPFDALEEIIDTGCQRILTSGQRPTALEGESLIKELIRKAEDRICIMPGSGVRASNILELARTTGASEFHTSARLNKSYNQVDHLFPKEELTIPVPDLPEIESMLKELSDFFRS